MVLTWIKSSIIIQYKNHISNFLNSGLLHEFSLVEAPGIRSLPGLINVLLNLHCRSCVVMSVDRPSLCRNSVIDCGTMGYRRTQHKRTHSNAIWRTVSSQHCSSGCLINIHGWCLWRKALPCRNVIIFHHIQNCTNIWQIVQSFLLSHSPVARIPWFWWWPGQI